MLCCAMSMCDESEIEVEVEANAENSCYDTCTPTSMTPPACAPTVKAVAARAAASASAFATPSSLTSSSSLLPSSEGVVVSATTMIFSSAITGSVATVGGVTVTVAGSPANEARVTGRSQPTGAAEMTLEEINVLWMEAQEEIAGRVEWVRGLVQEAE